MEDDDEYEFEVPEGGFPEDLSGGAFIAEGEDDSSVVESPTGGKPKKSWKEHLHQKKEWKNTRKERRDKEQDEIELLEKRIQDDALPRGTNPLAYTDADSKKGDYQVYYPAAKTFADLPISTRTKKGLKEFNFTHMTEIQRAAIPHALCGRDILGAAKTGSGKTLAFVIPVIEKLFRSKWNVADGLGAIVITPNRELAVQIFEVMRKVGRYHSLSCGLVIGGKSVKFEKERIYRMNILICTPGRLLQHMDETTGFECTQLQILVLDEADQILDMGFEKTLNSIVEGLPPTRQTLLFSATQTKSVKDLARLSLNEPEYVAVHEQSETVTPVKLIQHVVIVNLQDKIDTLWSFVKSHLNSKILVFLSSCKQVRYTYEAFRKLRPGIQLMAINGKMKQLARTTVFFEFVKKKSALLFATDIAARGLDFPSVDWVFQVDCPENVQTYIHRVGRTARYNSSGNSLLMLLPSESKMIDVFQASKIPVKVIKINPSQQKSITSKLEELLVQDQELKYLAQKAFISYMRSIFLMSNKEVFNVYDLPAAEFAKSMGLPSTPRIKYIKAQKVDKNYAKSALEKKLDEEEQREKDEQDRKEGKKKKPQQVVTHVEKLFNRKSALADNFAKLRKEEEEESEDDLLVPKRMDHKLEDEEASSDDEEDDDADKYIGEEVTGKRKTFVPSDDESEEEEEEDVKRKKKQVKVVPPPQPMKKPAKAMSLEDTEKLALQILQKRKL